MKNTLILLFIAAFAIESHSQNPLGKYELTLNGNYKTQLNDEPIGSYQSKMKSNNFKLAFGINRSINQWLLVGIGTTYLNNDDNYDYYYYNSTNEFAIMNTPSIESEVWMPFVNIKLNKNIGDKVFIGLNIINGYCFKSEKKESTTYLATNFISDVLQSPSETTIQGGLSTYESESDKQFYNFSIEPEIAYIFSNSLGIKIQGILYQFDSINKHQAFFSTNTKQITWTFGIIYRIN